MRFPKITRRQFMKLMGSSFAVTLIPKELLAEPETFTFKIAQWEILENKFGFRNMLMAEAYLEEYKDFTHMVYVGMDHIKKPKDLDQLELEIKRYLQKACQDHYEWYSGGGPFKKPLSLQDIMRGKKA